MAWWLCDHSIKRNLNDSSSGCEGSSLSSNALTSLTPDTRACLCLIFILLNFPCFSHKWKAPNRTKSFRFSPQNVYDSIKWRGWTSYNIFLPSVISFRCGAVVFLLFLCDAHFSTTTSEIVLDKLCSRKLSILFHTHAACMPQEKHHTTRG